MKKVIVQMSSHFNMTVSTRAAVQNLFKLSKRKIDELIFDFSGIQFISSSASHQFVLEVRELEKQSIPVTIINMNKDIETMLELAKTDRKNIFTIQNIKHLNVTSKKDLSNLLLEV